MKKKIIKKKIVKKAKVKIKPARIATQSVAGGKKLIGKITHYYSDIKVIVIRLKDTLKVGDEIRITGGENTDFNQKVQSMQIDHKKVMVAKKGSFVGLKIKKKAREDYVVYKL
jgi:putative protease